MFSVFKKINPFAKRTKIIDFLAVFFAIYALYILVFLLGIYALLADNLRALFYPLLSGFFAAFVLNKIIYIVYKEKRPAAYKNTTVLISVPLNPSFPSRHAAFLFGISFNLLYFNISLAVFFIACSSLVGIARVFSGVHWFRDILAGLFIGFISSSIIHALSGYINL